MTKQQLFYGHDTGQYVLAGISASVVKDDCHHKKTCHVLQQRQSNNSIVIKVTTKQFC